MFHGSMVALVTPMHPERNEVDYPTLSKLIEMHIEKGTSAIVVAGTTGEAATLTQAEALKLITHCVEVAAERIPIIAGTASNSTASAIEKTEQAIHAGADAALIMTPAYIKPTQEGLYQHYSAIAHAVAIPIIVYNVPSRTACDLLPETLERLSHIPNIIGIKEATGDIERVKQIRALCGDSIDIYSGEDPLTRELILNGGKGVISVTANLLPAQFAQMCKLALAGDEAGSKTINDSLTPLYNTLFLETNPIPVKWAMQSMGLISPAIRLPLMPLAAEHHQAVRQALADLNIG